MNKEWNDKLEAQRAVNEAYTKGMKFAKQLKQLSDYAKHLNFNIQFYNNEVNYYIDRPDDDSEMYSHGSFENVEEALDHLLKFLKKRLKTN